MYHKQDFVVYVLRYGEYVRCFYIMRHFPRTLSSNANFITFMPRISQKANTKPGEHSLLLNK